VTIYSFIIAVSAYIASIDTFFVNESSDLICSKMTSNKF